MTKSAQSIFGSLRDNHAKICEALKAKSLFNEVMEGEPVHAVHGAMETNLVTVCSIKQWRPKVCAVRQWKTVLSVKLGEVAKAKS